MGGIGARVRALSARAELLIVVVLAFAWFVYSSSLNVVDLVSGTRPPPVTETRLIGLLAFETIMLVALGRFLRTRGWSVDDLGLNPSWGNGATGFALGVALRVAQALVLVFATNFAYQISVATFWHLLGQEAVATDAASFPPGLS